MTGQLKSTSSVRAWLGPTLCSNEGPEIMKYACVTFVALLFCTGCGRDQLPSESVVPEDAPPAAASEHSRQYPKLVWTEPVPESEPGVPTVIGVESESGPASVRSLRMRFDDRLWTEAENATFTVWLTENDFLRITIAPDSKRMVGTVKTTRTIDGGPLRGELLGEIRTTQPFANEDEALSLLEAYLKQDGTFDTLVRWSNTNTGDSDADASERSP